MPSPDRKKISKHNKKKDKLSSHRSTSKHKSKKKKQSRTPSRNREKKKDYKRESKDTPVFSLLNQEYMKKWAAELKDVKRTEDLLNFQFLPFLKQANSFTDNHQEQKQSKEKKSFSKSRLLLPINYDTFMIILEDPFYQEHLSVDMINYMKKRLLQSLKKQVIDQKQDVFLPKVDKLEQDLKKLQQTEELEQPSQLGIVASIFNVLKNKQDPKLTLDPEIKDVLQVMEVEIPSIERNEIFEEAKQMFL